MREDKGKLLLAGNQKELRKCRLNNQDAILIFKALVGTSIIHINVSYNRISYQGIACLAEYLKDKNCCVQHLNLCYNDFGSAGAITLSEALQFNDSVDVLLMDGNKIGQDGGMQMASMLQVNSIITTLSLADTDLTTDCIIALSTILRANQSITSIDLSNPLLHSHQEDTTCHIAQMLEINKCLKELKLQKHGMTDYGAEMLCRFLKRNHALTKLDISCNKLSRDGAGYIADLLRVNHHLRELNISFNRIEDEGIEQISKVLAQSNFTLFKLNICSNSIGDKGLCKLAAAIRENPTVNTLYIWGNKLGTPTCDAFSQLLQSGILNQQCIDVRPYVVDGVNYLARIDNYS
ncbi:leucine-rich repeat-containing protein 34-like isoform X2 [Dysidea avara]